MRWDVPTQVASMDAPLRRSLVAVAAACPVLFAAAPAHAVTGGTGAPAGAPTAPLAQNGGATAGTQAAVPTAPSGNGGGVPAGANVVPMKAKTRAQMPTLASFLL